MTAIIIKAITCSIVYVISNHGSYVYIDMYNMILYKVLTKFSLTFSNQVWISKRCGLNRLHVRNHRRALHVTFDVQILQAIQYSLSP